MKLSLAIPDLVSSSYFPALAAVRLGFFQREGLDVTLQHVFPVPACFEALSAKQVDMVVTSAHGPLWAFPRWQGCKVLCSVSQGMYWFLVVRKELSVRKGNLHDLKGLYLAAAPGVATGLEQLFRAARIDPESEHIRIKLPPNGIPQGQSFGVAAADACMRGEVDGFWANGMAAELAVSSGIARCVLDVRRGDGPAEAFHFTQPALMVRDTLVESQPNACRGAIRAIRAAHDALRTDVSLANQVARDLFPPRESALIERLIERDLPYYSTRVEPSLIEGMNAFCIRAGLMEPPNVPMKDIVATQFADEWR